MDYELYSPNLEVGTLVISFCILYIFVQSLLLVILDN
jgi:hypothetical protein